jgi:hypothetical protein
MTPTEFSKNIAKLMMAMSLLSLSVACSPGFEAAPQASGGAGAAAAAATVLALSAGTSSVAPNQTMQFSVTGGVAPYIFKITSGVGDIDSGTGLFLASATEGTVQVTVTDAAGAKASATVSVTASVAVDPGAVLVTSWSPSSVQPSDHVTLSVTGGTAPYTYTLIQGNGTLTGAQYAAPATAEAVTINVTDSSSNSARIAFSVGAIVSSTVPGISLASINIYLPGSVTGQCGGNGTFVGQTGWMVGPHHDWRGSVQFCESAKATASSDTIVSDFVLTGFHNTGAQTCPTGYSNIGSIVDCRGGYCGGNQTFCAQLASPTVATRFVTDFYLTPEGKRAASGSALCSAGYTSIGEVADCGGGICGGVQQICVRKQ